MTEESLMDQREYFQLLPIVEDLTKETSRSWNLQKIF